MDFPGDKKTFKTSDEYMFGPSILVCPITKEMFNFSKVTGEDIESSYFFTKDGTENGLNLDIYKGTDFNKLLLSRKFDASQLGWSGCLPNSLDTSYSLKMEGKILSDLKGRYTFRLISDGGVKLWINDTLLIDDWNNNEKKDLAAEISLGANTKYSFRLEHRQPVKNNALIKINWIKPLDCTSDSKTADVYLPGNESWFDFWTGAKIKGGQALKADAPIDKIPLYIPEGSLIPMGPGIQYAEEKKDGPMELRIYPGKNSSFTIYEDEGDSYNYEKGSCSEIPLQWNEN
jgi:alpha-D-xyloside xylohydrolase